MDILFWKHSTSSQKKNNMCTIYLRVTVDGIRSEIGSTGLKINTKHWNESLQRISVDDPLCSFKNEQLGLLETKLWAIHNDFLRRNQSVSADRIRRSYVLPTAITYVYCFEEFFKWYDKRKDIAPSSKKTLKNIKNLASRFLMDNGIQDILVEEFDYDIMDDFKAWGKGSGYKDSYTIRAARSVAAVVKFAKKKKWISTNPLEGYIIGHEKIVSPKYVNSIQLGRWMAHKFRHQMAQKVADIFILYARTGFHYQDLMQIIKKPDHYIMTGIDGKQWIKKPRQKTELEAKVPIERFPEIKKIVDKYGGWHKLPTMPNTKLNDWLKLCAAEINLTLVPGQHIYPELSVKHGRSSFCDYCLNELGLGTDALLPMMGRVSAAELDRYVRKDERGIITAFKISDAALAS